MKRLHVLAFMWICCTALFLGCSDDSGGGSPTEPPPIPAIAGVWIGTEQLQNLTSQGHCAAQELQRVVLPIEIGTRWSFQQNGSSLTSSISYLTIPATALLTGSVDGSSQISLAGTWSQDDFLVQVVCPDDLSIWEIWRVAGQSLTFAGRVRTQTRITGDLDSTLAIVRPLTGVVEETMTVRSSITLDRQ